MTVTVCPVCAATGEAAVNRVPAGEPVRVVDGADVWLQACPTHPTADVAAALDGFQSADGAPLAEVPA